MHYFGKAPLRMKCPHCEAYGEHPVVRTDPKQYYWDDEATEMFKRIAGKDISYRRRIKRCVKCGRKFSSVEMANIFLEALVKEVQQLERSRDLARSLLASAHK